VGIEYKVDQIYKTQVSELKNQGFFTAEGGTVDYGIFIPKAGKQVPISADDFTFLESDKGIAGGIIKAVGLYVYFKSVGATSVTVQDVELEEVA